MPRAVISKTTKYVTCRKSFEFCAEAKHITIFWPPSLDSVTHGQMTSINELELPRSVKDKLINGKVSIRVCCIEGLH